MEVDLGQARKDGQVHGLDPILVLQVFGIYISCDNSVGGIYCCRTDDLVRLNYFAGNTSLSKQQKSN